MNNTRFATITHILTLLAKFPDQWLSSDWIAESININPVIVRKELSILQRLGWVVSEKGKEGGSMLNASGYNVSMADIYNVVKNSNVLGKKNIYPNSKCPVGRNINKELEKLFKETDQRLITALRKKSLKALVRQFA